LHSAAWDNAAEFKGKSVGVIGTGSSSIQIVPTLSPVVDKMTVHIRSSVRFTPDAPARR
jgi:cation diffusion facilitator CzcD-associated flavoprotein CzcO